MPTLRFVLLVALSISLCSGELFPEGSATSTPCIRVASREDVDSPGTTGPPTAIASPSPAPTLSGCQVCDKTGDCSHAYLNGPGHYCGPWLDQLSQRQSCCCPHNAACQITNYSCKCAKITTPRSTTKQQASSSHSHSSGSGGLGAVIGLSIVVSCCIGFCCCARRSTSQPTRLFFGTGSPAYDVLPSGKTGVVYAQEPMYHPYAAPAMAPAYHPGYGYNPGYSYGHTSNGSSLAAGGLGAVAGLATGMLIADSVSHHHSGGYSGGDYGGFSGGAGGDFGGGGGDFGGDF